MANEQNKEKVSYTKTAFMIPNKDAELGQIVGFVEGFVKSVKIREVNTKNGIKKVADLLLSVVMTDKRVEHLLGEKVVNKEYHSVSFRITYWGLAADRIEKYPPQKNQKGIALISNMKVNKYTTNDGKVHYSVEGTGNDFFHTNSKMKEDGDTALTNGAGTHTDDGSVDMSSDFMEDVYSEDEELPF